MRTQLVNDMKKDSPAILRVALTTVAIVAAAMHNLFPRFISDLVLSLGKDTRANSALPKSDWRKSLIHLERRFRIVNNTSSRPGKSAILRLLCQSY
jgi:hypothetical protein